MKKITPFASIIIVALAITIMLPKSTKAPEMSSTTISSPKAEVIEQKPSAPIAPEIPKMDLSTEDRAAKIDQYFSTRGMPLAGYGKTFVEAADKYAIDWAVLAAISIAESTGGKKMCENNPFGWASCRSGFDSIEEAIDYVSMNLGGQNPRTARAYSGGTRADLQSYNGTVEPGYPAKVMRYMIEIMNTPLPY